MCGLQRLEWFWLFLSEFVMNYLVYSLYKVYSTKKKAKESRKSLDKKYKTKDAGAKKCTMSSYLNFKMVESKTVISQLQEL